MDPRPFGRRLGVHAAATALICGALSATALATMPAQAARLAPTCAGQQATIVGSQQGDKVITGTDGDDVIVTNGNYGVEAGPGDDIICVTAHRGDTGGDIDDGPYVDAGPGEDAVYIPTDRFGEYAFRTDVNLGSGSDTFTSAGGRVDVDDGDTDGGGNGSDNISNTGGYLRVTVGDGGVLTDDVSLSGVGNEVTVKADRMAPDALIEASEPGSTVTFGSETPGDWRIDNPAGSVTRDGEQQFHLDGFTQLIWTSTQPVSFVGGPAEETLVADTVTDADLGGGNDTLDTTLAGAAELGADRRFAGGAGRDSLVIVGINATEHATGQIDVQHVRGTSSVASLDGAPGFPIAEFESYRLYAATAVSFTGGGADDRVRAFACGGTTTLRGGNGDDRLVTNTNNPSFDHFLSCSGRNSTSEIYGENGGDRIISGDEERATIFGGRGDDDVSGGRGKTAMTGGTGADVLDGGRGKDSANGASGKDYCRAEKRTHCERGATR